MTVTSCTPSSGSTAGGTLVTIGGTDFTVGMAVEFDGTPATSVAITPPTGAIASWGYFRTDENFTEGDTITLGTQTYTFRDALTDVAGYLLIGGSVSDSLDIFSRATIGGPGRGTTYADSTPVNADAEGYRYGSWVKAIAITAGAAGDTIACASSTVAEAHWFWEGYAWPDPSIDFLFGGSDGTSSTSLTCRTPAHAAGAVDIRVYAP